MAKEKKQRIEKFQTKLSKGNLESTIKIAVTPKKKEAGNTIQVNELAL